MHKTDPRLQDVSNETIIWRYLSLPSFYSMLMGKSLSFRRLDKYTYDFEDTLPEKTREALYNYRLHFYDTNK